MKGMAKIWYLYIDDHQEGPFTYLELSKDDRLTPETFAWKEGMEDWKPIAEIEELKKLVDPGKHEEEGSLEFEEPAPAPDEEIVLEMKDGGPPPYLWIVIILIVLFYALYEYFWWQ